MEQILSLNNLSLGYEKKEIYGRINATASQGEIISIIGANGTGKSTLIKTICGLIPPYSGHISLYQKDYRTVKEQDLSRQIAYVPSLMARARNLKVFDMLATNCYFRSDFLGRVAKADRQLILDSLSMVGLDGFENRDSFSLSDGEYQRCTIAAALVKSSPIILLDEPTAFLDIANKLIITTLLKEIAHNSNKCILFSTHELQLAINDCDKIWVMGFEQFYDKAPAELISIGAFDKIFKIPGLVFDPISNTYRTVSL